MTNRRHSQHSPGGGRKPAKSRRFSIKGSNSSGGPSKYEIAYDLRRCGRHFARGIHNSVRLCGTGVGTLRTYESDDGTRATVSARHNCHSAWACPVCSPKIASARQRILAPQVVKLLERGYTARLVTLTLRHAQGDDLGYLLDGLGEAWGALTKGRAWQNWRSIGRLAVEYVRGLDLTWSLRNGWHPHLHIALYLPPGHDGDVDWFITRWIACLRAEGFIAIREAQDAGREITLESAKEAERVTAYAGATAAMPSAEALGMAMKRNRAEGSFGPFEMLARAAAGDAYFEKRWKEYLEATKGRRQVTVSRGLRLSDDKDLTLADDVATLGPEAKEEAECSGLIPALLSAARCADQDERRVSVASVLSRLVARDWRMLEPRPPVPLSMPTDDPPPDPDRPKRKKAKKKPRRAYREPKLVAAWEVSNNKKRFRAMQRIPGGWKIDRLGEVGPIPPDALAMMPPDAVLAALSESGKWFWVTEADWAATRNRRQPPEGA